MRDKLAQLEGKDLVVTFAVGQRGDIATQILPSRGIKTRNLECGLTTWQNRSMLETG